MSKLSISQNSVTLYFLICLYQPLLYIQKLELCSPNLQVYNQTSILTPSVSASGVFDILYKLNDDDDYYYFNIAGQTSLQYCCTYCFIQTYIIYVFTYCINTVRHNFLPHINILVFFTTYESFPYP